MPRVRDRIGGCLVGSVVGEAVGLPTSGLDAVSIRHRWGGEGLTDLEPVGCRWGAVTDVAHVSLFVGEGLIRALRRRDRGEPWDPVSAVRRALQRWTATRGVVSTPTPDGWLASRPRLRLPGGELAPRLRAALAGGLPINGPDPSCLVWIAPVGVAVPPAEAFRVGLAVAQLTHRMPVVKLAAAASAALVSRMVRGEPIADAVASVRAELVRHPEHQPVLSAVDRAVRSAKTQRVGEALASLGSGRSAEEALAVALLCATKTRDFVDGVLLAVNQGGASAATGALTGQLCGILWGAFTIPVRWLELVDLLVETEEIADDLAFHVEGDHAGGWRLPEELEARYPAA